MNHLKHFPLIHSTLLALTLGLSSMLALNGLVQANDSILVQSTTSTANSGLYDHLLPLFEAQHKLSVKVVAVGTGQAIKNAQNCDADVLLVHAKSAELAFVDAGYGVERHDLMYNDFVIVGPAADPANLQDANDALDALQRIAMSENLFASRGDDSGTHKKEMFLWRQASLNPATKWYRSTGSGMGATLNTGIGIGAYVLTDRATWIAFGNKADYQIVFEGDERLFNQYGIIRVNEAHCPQAQSAQAQVFIDWLVSKTGQRAIESFELQGQQLFYPSALSD